MPQATWNVTLLLGAGLGLAVIGRVTQVRVCPGSGEHPLKWEKDSTEPYGTFNLSKWKKNASLYKTIWYQLVEAGELSILDARE